MRGPNIKTLFLLSQNVKNDMWSLYSKWHLTPQPNMVGLTLHYYERAPYFDCINDADVVTTSCSVRLS